MQVFKLLYSPQAEWSVLDLPNELFVVLDIEEEKVDPLFSQLYTYSQDECIEHLQSLSIEDYNNVADVTNGESLLHLAAKKSTNKSHQRRVAFSYNIYLCLQYYCVLVTNLTLYKTHRNCLN